MSNVEKEIKDVRGLKKSYNFLIQNKYIFLSLIVLVLLIFFFEIFGLIDLIGGSSNEEKLCGDGTVYNSCSKTKPYFCSNGKLIEYASVCGCPNNWIIEGDSCFSPYSAKPREISLNYIIRSRKYSSSFIVYEEFADYTSKIPRSIKNVYSQEVSRADFKIKSINDEEQREMLMPLVIKIQNMTTDKEDQVRIAISIVQNIPFGYSNKNLTFGNYIIPHSRYPYEVLYDNEGVCGEKTDLLIFLLKELGYGAGFFYYPQYNHEAVGIKCPIQESLMQTEYCFVETTAPAIITDNNIYYTGSGRLISEPQFYLIYEGEALNKELYEYSDAESLQRIRELADENGYLWPMKRKMFEELEQKYGLVEEYYVG